MRTVREDLHASLGAEVIRGGGGGDYHPGNPVWGILVPFGLVKGQTELLRKAYIPNLLAFICQTH
jgi:hypothetical protein